jgi:O-antigen/teichoic acid export membrane protein
MFPPDARLKRIILTAGGTYLGRFGLAIVALVTLPMARQALHAELFGIWMMLSALLGFMAFADLGVGNGVLNKITEAQAAGDRARLRKVLGSGYACTGGVGILVALAWLAWSRLSDDPTIVVGRISPEHRPEAMAALTVFALVLAINIPASLIQRVQLGMQQGYWNGVAQFAGAGVTLVAVPLALRSDGGLAALVLATIGVQAAVNIVNTVIWLHRNGLLQLGGWRGALDFGMVRALLRLGSMFFLLQLAASFAFQSDAIVITQTLGQAAYGDFAIVQRLFLFVSMLMSAAMMGLWPAFGDALARGETHWVRRTLGRALLITALIMGSVCLALTLSIGTVMQLWLGEPHGPPLLLTGLLAAWAVVEALGTVVASLLNGANLIRAQVLIAVTMGVASFAGKWLLVHPVGSAGVVLATLVAYACISIPAQVLLLVRLLRRTAPGAPHRPPTPPSSRHAGRAPPVTGQQVTMLSKIKRTYARAVSLLQVQAHIDRRLDEVLLTQGALLAQLARQRTGSRLSDFEFKVFSQWGEDGIIQKLIRHLDIPNKAFVEFGVQDFSESNCRFLLMHDNWRGLVIDASTRDMARLRDSPMTWRHHLEVVCEFITRDNIDELIARAGLGHDIGILSVDIDGVDYWVLDAIQRCSPRILIVEYNAVFGPERAISVPYDARFVRTEKHHSNLYFGASLAAFHHLATRRGYSLIGTNSAGSNAFFVRSDQMERCPFPALAPTEAFVESLVRESRDPAGHLSFLAGAERLAAIRGLPVVDVITGLTEKL